MDKEFINECIDIIEQIKLGSIIAIIKDKEELRYQLIYNDKFDYFELICLDEENAIWDDGDTAEEIKERLLCSAIRDRYQKIRLI